ncbi:MAG TPA: ParB N-terminal domain-containing protein [Allocoleopsis sp.]
MPINLAAIVDKPWPFVRGYLIQELGLGDRLDNASDNFAIGYLSRATRMDLGKICSKGQVCGSSCIPRKRKCSPDKQAATSKTAKEASTKARGKLIEDLKGERDRKRNERASKKLTSEKEIANVEQQQTPSSPSAKKRNSTNMNTTTATRLGQVPNTAIVDRGTKIVSTKRISGESNLSNTEAERMAQSILQNGLQAPIVVKRNGMDYEAIAGSDALAGLRKAREINPMGGESANVFVANDDDEAVALSYQANLYSVPKTKTSLPKASRETDAVRPEKLGSESLVSTKRISGGGDYDADTVEKLAQSQLKVGNILPAVVKRTKEGEFEVVSGGLAIAAARRTREINPMGGEKVRVFIANNDDEAVALSYQVGDYDKPYKK